VIDTPGLRTLRPDADEATLAATFDDVAALAAHADFATAHTPESQGAPVREGIGVDRLRNLPQALARDAPRHVDGARRQRQRAEWKARGRAAEVRMRAKRGE
jgi:ribosome biogenesis GTPase